MQTVAQAWLVYRLTESSFMLGVVAFCNLAPVLLLGLFGGVVADHFSRHRLLVIAHSIAMIQALALAVLTLSGWVTPIHIIFMALLLGVVLAFEMPARHSFLAEMVPREDLSNAIALNSSAFNIARFIGPSIAGILVAAFGEGVVFLINGMSFFAVLFALLLMKIPVHIRGDQTESAYQRVLQGLNFAWNNLHVRAALLMIAMISLVSASITVLMPVFAREVYFGNSTTLGMLLSAVGAGALLGALKLAYRRTIHGIDRVIGIAALSTGVCVMLFSYIDVLWYAMPVLVILGFSQTLAAASTNTLIQFVVTDQIRGRVMSLFSMIFIGLMPVGSLMAGALSEAFDASNVALFFGGLCLIGAFLFIIYTPRTQALN